MRKYIAFATAVLIAGCSISTAVSAQEAGSEAFNYFGSAEDIMISGRDITTKGILEIPEKYNEQNITVIESGGFDDYSEITKVIIPENVKVIEDTAFQDCTNLTEIDLPRDLVKIGKMAFDNSSFANDIKNWTKDGEALYLDNYLIRVNPLISGSFEIKDGTTLIADSAFEGCKNITDVKIPKSVKYIGKDAFKDCGVMIANQGVDSVYIDECLIRSDCEGSFVVSENTRVIAGGCFMNNQKLSSVVISNNVLTVGEDAFLCCPSLKTISIGSNVDYIGENAFLLCDSLEKISVSADNKNFRVQDGLLYSGDTVIRCPEKKEGIIKLDEKTIYIGKGAFSGCKDISSVIFSQKLKGIGKSAFSECYSLSELSLPDSLSNIGNFAFSYCNSLCEVKLPDSVQMLGHSVFSYCENLESVDLGKGVEEIPAWTFQYCKNIKYVNMNNIKKTGKLCFFKTKIIDDDSNYDENGMLIIDNCLLKVMPGFEKYDIPEGVKLICSGCFEDCGDIELIVLPTSLEYIDSEALQTNGSVKKIVYSGTEGMWNEKGFTKSIGEYPAEGISMVQDIPYMGIGIILVASVICVLIALFVYKKDKGLNENG